MLTRTRSHHEDQPRLAPRPGQAPVHVQQADRDGGDDSRYQERQPRVYERRHAPDVCHSQVRRWAGDRAQGGSGRAAARQGAVGVYVSQ